ncbi:glycerate kinase [Aquimarina sp. I32.4]|uniref:glycerate kinase n=1 Tax=Aquimarina sp. I32.4 TaxID=2053903 RepID=UPI000CDEBC2F|nr:glycerate kinase [Aquimarina sp. I32.4]
MKIIIAPDKFKGSLSADEVCDSIAEGIHQYDSTIEVVKHPLADGGDGSLEILDRYLDLETISITVKDPLWRNITSYYKKTDNIAYIEMAKASGLVLLTPEERNCFNTTSYGTGELIMDAINKGVTKIYLFIGGSATCDVGIGMASALGYRFLDKTDREIVPIGKNLDKIHTIEKPKHFDRLKNIHFVVLCDVDNPLLGKNGTAYVYGPQKGANPEEVIMLDKGLEHFSLKVNDYLQKDITSIACGGASGGLGAGSIAFFNAQLKSGIEIVFDITDFETICKNADIIISGEGKIDKQTMQGKVVSHVAKYAFQNDITFYAIVGKSEITSQQINKLHIEKLETVISFCQTEEEAFSHVRAILVTIAKNILEN